MAWRHNLFPQHRKTLEYFDRYDYPLTKQELEYWSSPVSPSSIPPLNLRGGKSGGVIYKNGYFFYKNKKNLINIRKQREKYSLLKWGIAYTQATKLAKIPFVEAIFVTGSLAMSNCKKTDDIDLMIVTSAETLWITRFIINIFLSKSRRFPNVKTAPDKICTNLWLDIRNLKIPERNLYHAHEILQAKCIFDKGGIHDQFLKQNPWVKDYLPNAYLSLLKLPSPKFRRGTKGEVFLKNVNYILFCIQYLYMLPKKSTEKVGLGYAFFHPIKK